MPGNPVLGAPAAVAATTTSHGANISDHFFGRCRDQRALSQQVDKLQQSLSSIQEQHDQQLASAQAAHLQQLQDIRAQLETRQQQWVRAGWAVHCQLLQQTGKTLQCCVW
jgi:hypothetical protein